MNVNNIKHFLITFLFWCCLLEVAAQEITVHQRHLTFLC
jgi:hypothetical protein